MLTIGLDLRGLSPQFKEHFGRGTGRYAAELAKRLLVDTDSCRVSSLGLDELSASPWQKRLLQWAPAGRQTLETQFFLPRRFGNLTVDVIHFLSHGDATARCPKPYLATVLDLIPLRFPDLYKAAKPSWRYHLARYFELSSIRSASGLLAISEATKRDVVEILGVPEDSVFVTPLAVGPEFTTRPAHSDDRAHNAGIIRTRFGIPLQRPLLFYSGGIDPRKNVGFLLRVFAEACKVPVSAARPVLVLAGRIKQDDRYPDFRREIERLGIAPEVFELGFVSDDDLISLYQAADIFVFPSLYEGFGLPVLEAMACGAPVVAGRNSSLPEIAGEAAVLLADSDISAWVTEISAILMSPERRQSLGEKGIREAAKFSWESTAKLTLEAYKYFNRRWQWSKDEFSLNRAVA